MSGFQVRPSIFILFFSATFMVDLTYYVGAKGLETEELSMDYTDTFTELVEDVFRLFERKSIVEIIVNILDDEVECRILHGWKNMSQYFWLVNNVFVPDTRYKQVTETGYLSITVPKTRLEHGPPRDPNFTLHALVENTVFFLQFNLPDSASHPVNALGARTFADEINVSTFRVSPSKDIGYTPGEQVVLMVDEIKGSHSKIECGFYSLTGGDAVIVDGFKLRDVIRVRNEFKAGKPVSTIIIDTTSMPSGGLVSITTWTSESESGTHLKEVSFASMQTVRLHLVGTDSPVPYNRVAIETEKTKTQYLNRNSPETTIYCTAIGNPTPTIEFLIGGQPVHWEHYQWSREYRTTYRALVWSYTRYDHVTCRAKSGDAVAEMLINIKH